MNRIVVSLTTTSQRIELCRATLLSLTTQSLIPNEIIANLSKQPYLRDKGIKDNDILLTLTEGIPAPLKDIISIRWVKNTGPYRKLIPALQQAEKNDCIITADDDIFYNKNWLKLLLKDFNPNERTIHASRVRVKSKNIFGKYTGYNFWPLVKSSSVMTNNWIITYGGGAVLYRKWFRDELIENDEFLIVSPTSDDLWYSKICQLSNLSVKII